MSCPIDLHYDGTYSLAQSVRIARRASFVPEGDPATLEIGFPLEGGWESVAVRITQSGACLSADVLANPNVGRTEQIRRRLEHMLSLDVSATGFAALGDRDPVVRALQEASPGLRPILFSSPYEAAARAIIGHRLPVRQGAALARRLAARDGLVVTSGDRPIHVFPGPAGLARIAPVEGLSDRKVDQLRALGAATLDGWLSSERLASMPTDQASKHLQQLGGIGPFSAELILIRGLGDPDFFPLTELRLQRAMTAAYALDEPPSPAVLNAVADRWRPYRSWVGLLLRNAEIGVEAAAAKDGRNRKVPHLDPQVSASHGPAGQEA